MKLRRLLTFVLVIASCLGLSAQASARLKRKKELRSHFQGMQIALPDSPWAALSFLEAVAAPKPLATGVATWYGPGFHRRKTANGERYDMHARTCASPSLPFDTWIEITNLDNGKKTYARVNDRLPARRKSVILDASYAIARELGFAKKGKAKIEIRKVEDETLAALEPR